MKVGVDTETGLLRRGLLAPPLVCVTLSTEAAEEGDPVSVYRWNHVQTDRGVLLKADDGAAAIGALLQGGATLVLHNAPYDLAVLGVHEPRLVPEIWRAYHEGRIVDTKVRERVIRVALGELEYSLQRGPDGPAMGRTRYDLASLVRRYHGAELVGKARNADGSDPWRLRYAELADVPLDEWPEEAVDYAISDAYWALEVADAQLADYPRVLGGYETRGRDGRPLAERRETIAAWVLHLWATWGVRTSPAGVRAALSSWAEHAAAGRAVGLRRGWVRPNGTRDLRATQAAVAEALGPQTPRTKPSKTFPDGQVKTDEETLESCGGDLAVYATAASWDLVASRWGHALPLGCAFALTSRPESLIETGRTSWSDPPLQQPPREGGVRECIVPRPGWVLCSVDYDAAELVALAQVCLWAGLGSSLGDAINRGIDPHLQVAAELLGLTYEEAGRRRKASDEAVVEARQVAKALNFGLPGGLQAEGFRGFARGYGIELSAARAAELVEWWYQLKPEIRAYFRWVEARLGPEEIVQHPVSMRLRGGTRYTAALNGYFQGLVADGAKYGAEVLTSCAYGYPHPDLVEGRLPRIGQRRGREIAELLAGRIRPVLFLHDEILSEIPEAVAHDVAEAKAEVMVAALQRHTPDVRVTAEPALMRRWSKAAKTVRDEHGRLLVWEAP